MDQSAPTLRNPPRASALPLGYTASSRGLLRGGVQLLLNKAGEILKPLKGRGGKLTGTGVDQAERAQASGGGVKNRKAGIEADWRFDGDQRVVGRPVDQHRVRDGHGQ